MYIQLEKYTEFSRSPKLLVLTWYLLICVYIKGDTTGKVNISGGDSISHWEKKMLYEQVSNSERLQKERCSNLQLQTQCEW